MVTWSSLLPCCCINLPSFQVTLQPSIHPALPPTSGQMTSNLQTVAPPGLERLSLVLLKTVSVFAKIIHLILRKKTKNKTQAMKHSDFYINHIYVNKINDRQFA